MQAVVIPYHHQVRLGFETIEATGIHQLKEKVRQVSLYATHVDVYLGPMPNRFKARVRRIRGFWDWKALERVVKESSLWPVL